MSRRPTLAGAADAIKLIGDGATVALTGSGGGILEPDALLDVLAVAQAAKACGGTVIAQVKRLRETPLDPREADRRWSLSVSSTLSTSPARVAAGWTWTSAEPGKPAIWPVSVTRITS